MRDFVNERLGQTRDEDVKQLVMKIEEAKQKDTDTAVQETIVLL